MNKKSVIVFIQIFSFTSGVWGQAAPATTQPAAPAAPAAQPATPAKPPAQPAAPATQPATPATQPATAAGDAAKKPAEPISPKTVGPAPAKKKSGFASYDPRAGLVYAPFLPLNITDSGFGALGLFAYGSVDVPQMNQFLGKYIPLEKYKIRIRPGMMIGYMTFGAQNSQQTGTFGLVPFFISLAVYYDLPKEVSGFSLSPSFKWSQGLIFSSSTVELDSSLVPQLAPGESATKSGSYMGYTNKFDFGIEARHKSNQKIAYFFDMGILLHFEQQSGLFLTFSLGGAYHFM